MLEELEDSTITRGEDDPDPKDCKVTSLDMTGTWDKVIRMLHNKLPMHIIASLYNYYNFKPLHIFTDNRANNIK